MEKKLNCLTNKPIVCKSLPYISIQFQPNRTLQLQRSSSLTFHNRSCSAKFQFYKPSEWNIEKSKVKKEKSNPTIGDLLGDDDLFHARHRYQYSISKTSRKRNNSHIDTYHHRSKSQRSTYMHRNEKSSHQFSSSTFTETVPNINQFYPYPPIYNYLPISSCGYYCYSNMASCCPYFVSDCYTRLYYQEMVYESSTHDYSSTYSSSSKNKSESHAYP
ncbi:hypothetical protein I4U23_008188 [Adineta vaga]|nr:hypothetical protein I4U23_008188 [Adineta vaga]